MTESKGNELMLIGAKETFVIRALEKKLTEAGIPMFFVQPDIDDVDQELPRTAVVAYYLDQSEKIEKKFLVYLNDRLVERDIQLIIIGEKTDINEATPMFSPGVILKVYERPLNAEEFISLVLKQLEEVKNPAKKSILVVDDDATYIGLIRDWLREKYKVSMAISGMQAISVLATTHVDLILLDYEMPITSGAQVLQMLRSDPRTEQVPVIFLTGKSDKESVMQVVSLKPEGYLLKSITREDLMMQVDKFFMKQRMN